MLLVVKAIAMAKASADASGEGKQNGDNKTAEIEKAAAGKKEEPKNETK